MQVIFFKENVALAVANTEQRELLSDGDVVNKPYRSHPQAVDYTKGTDITVKDRFSTNEQLTVNTAKVVPFYVDDIDKIQNKWDAATKFAADAQRLLNNILDQAILGEYSNATSSVDAGDVGGASGSAISSTVSNISQTYTAGGRKLDDLNIPTQNRFAIIGPRLLETTRLYLAGKDTELADKVGMNGIVLERFGFQIFYSNNLPFTATLGMAANPTDGDTVTIASAILEFKTTISGATAGSIGVLRDGSLVDTSRAALVAAINDSGTAGTTYTAQATGIDVARWRLTNAGVVATNDDSNDQMTIVAYGDIVVSETLTDGTDAWASQQSHALFGMKGATDLVVQKSPNVEFRLAEKRLGRFVYPWMLFGKKTFTDLKDALVDVQIDASGWN